MSVEPTTHHDHDDPGDDLADLDDVLHNHDDDVVDPTSDADAPAPG